MANLVLVYRTGGRENFKWHRSIEFSTFSEAEAGSKSLTQSGYKNYILSAEISNIIGLPETFSSETNTSCRFEGEAYCVVRGSQPHHICY